MKSNVSLIMVFSCAMILPMDQQARTKPGLDQKKEIKSAHPLMILDYLLPKVLVGAVYGYCSFEPWKAIETDCGSSSSVTYQLCNGDKELFMHNDDNTVVYDVLTGEKKNVIKTHKTDKGRYHQASPDGSLLLLARRCSEPVGYGGYTLYDVKTKKSRPLKGDAWIFGPRFSTTGKYIGALWDEKNSDRAGLYLFDTASGNVLKSKNMPPNTAGTGQMAFASDDSMIAVAHQDAKDGQSVMHVLDADLQTKRTWVFDCRRIYSLCFSRDNNYLLSVDGDCAYLWDRQSGVFLKQYVPSSSVLISACFSGQDAWVVVGSEDKKILFFDRDTGEGRLESHKYSRDPHPIASQDGEMVVARDDNNDAQFFIHPLAYLRLMADQPRKDHP